MSSSHFEEIGTAALAMALQEQPDMLYAEVTGFAGLREVSRTITTPGGGAWVRTVKVRTDAFLAHQHTFPFN